MPNPLNSVLNLIAATILADKRVFASEVEVFIQQASRLEIVQRLDPKISEAKLLAWYELYKEAIESNLRTPYFKDWYYGLLEQISSLQDKEKLLDVMRNISAADGEVHVSERALIILAERYWGIAA